MQSPRRASVMSSRRLSAAQCFSPPYRRPECYSPELMVFHMSPDAGGVLRDASGPSMHFKGYQIRPARPRHIASAAAGGAGKGVAQKTSRLRAPTSFPLLYTMPASFARAAPPPPQVSREAACAASFVTSSSSFSSSLSPSLSSSASPPSPPLPRTPASGSVTGRPGMRSSATTAPIPIPRSSNQVKMTCMLSATSISPSGPTYSPVVRGRAPGVAVYDRSSVDERYGGVRGARVVGALHGDAEHRGDGVPRGRAL
ncbi:hypothetical protein BOTBODRAFT_467148 [Botryobasidium botryosum FD-172 SS1]|uniref:Uncharacterized protein n=1 Tax=Botryobasidium botryosum (strain FD-172 SS1) TaxID=930990 RepID=A0A067M6E0_BOTB1|nr:hypothetical protein BOTBODRAFT_467148 [Botryobasidium botryosum FD-172 SS1]